jgi:hypothetical protein
MELGRFVDTSVFADIVDRFVTGHSAFVCSVAIFNKGVCGAALHREEDGPSARFEITEECDVFGKTLIYGKSRRE